MRANLLTTIAAAGLAVSAAHAARPWLATEQRIDELAAVDHLEHALFGALPAGQRLAIARGMAERGDTEEAYSRVADLISREDFENLRPEWKTAIEKFEKNGNPGIAACFAPGTDPTVVLAFEQLLFGEGNRFQPGPRWTSTAYSGGGLSTGDPTTISYSFVPDGTTVADAGFGSGPSQLFAWLDGVYGNTATWQNLFHQVFNRWEELSGVTFVFEPSDDGATQSSSSNAGIPGVRGDVRIAAKSIDGNSGILAYNFFPNNGDMVLDAFDSFYSVTGGNSLRLRNVVAHEHGHGQGMNHVCPTNQTKLMEPFVSTAYDGPQLDDTLLTQRFYGDPLEDNDNPAQATPLGSVSNASFTQISIDDNSDNDYFSITVAQAAEINVTVTPTGTTYLEGPQNNNGSCSSGTNYDSLRVHDLGVDIIDTDGFTVLASADSNGLGQAENLSTVVDSAGTYFVRVHGDSTNSIQAYDFDLAVLDPPFVPASITFLGTPPSQVDPGVPTPVTVIIDPNDEIITPGSEALRFRNDGGAFQTIMLNPAGGMQYTAELPASPCGSSPEYYFQITGDQSGQITLPSQGAAAPFAAVVGTPAVVFDDNFETDTGWTVSGSVTQSTSGRWERGVPIAGSDGRISDPANDYDGSGQCYVTGNALDNSDVDNGDTILTSPAFDVAGDNEATITYARWFDNNEGGNASNPFTETFVIQISNDDGASWSPLETVGPTGSEVSGGWIVKTFRISDFVTPTSAVRIRFIASDDVGTIVEAGVDAVSVSTVSCTDPGNCNAADIAEPFGILDLSDISAFVTGFSGMDPIADLNGDGIYDLNDINIFVTAFLAGCP